MDYLFSYDVLVLVTYNIFCKAEKNYSLIIRDKINNKKYKSWYYLFIYIKIIMNTIVILIKTKCYSKLFDSKFLLIGIRMMDKEINHV